MILPQGRSELPCGITASTSFGQSIWVSFTAANIVPLRASTMQEKSLERRIPLSRSFHLSGRLGAAFARVRCWLATTADRRSASIGTAMWLDTLRAQMARELSCGRDARERATSVFCPAAITAARLTSTTRMRLPVHLGARPVSVPSFGPQTAIYAILGRYREIRRARPAQSTTTGMSLVTRKVHGGCALFCGLKQVNTGSWGAPWWKLQSSARDQRHGGCGWNFDKLVGRSRLYLDKRNGDERSQQRSFYDFRRSFC